MSAELPPASRIETRWLIGVAAAFAIFVLVAAYSSRMTKDYPDDDQQRADARKVTLKKVQDAENVLIEPVDSQGHPTAVWVDQAKGIVHIPIEEAMPLAINQLRTQSAMQGSEIPGTKPVTPAAPSGASTNAAPETPATTGSIALTPGEINKPVFNVRKVKTGVRIDSLTNAAPAAATPPSAPPNK